MARISGWIFISIGFVVIAVSIFMYDTLKFFIVLGGFMTLYGLGKLAVATFQQKWEKVESGNGIHINEHQNPYLQQQEQQMQRGHPKLHQAQRHAYYQQRAKYCSQCGTVMAVSHRFCNQCGHRA